MKNIVKNGRYNNTYNNYGLVKTNQRRFIKKLGCNHEVSVTLKYLIDLALIREAPSKNYKKPVLCSFIKYPKEFNVGKDGNEVALRIQPWIVLSPKF